MPPALFVILKFDTCASLEIGICLKGEESLKTVFSTIHLLRLWDRRDSVQKHIFFSKIRIKPAEKHKILLSLT